MIIECLILFNEIFALITYHSRAKFVINYGCFNAYLAFDIFKGQTRNGWNTNKKTTKWF